MLQKLITGTIRQWQLIKKQTDTDSIYSRPYVAKNQYQDLF